MATFRNRPNLYQENVNLYGGYVFTAVVADKGLRESRLHIGLTGFVIDRA